MIILFFRLVQRNLDLLENDEIVNKVISQLMKAEQYQEAGELYETVQKPLKALECYHKGHIYVKAVELAKFVSPKGIFKIKSVQNSGMSFALHNVLNFLLNLFCLDVVVLEENWGDHLVVHKQLDAAINHYIEAGKTVKALDAAVGARQWKKAVQIIQVHVVVSSPDV